MARLYGVTPTDPQALGLAVLTLALVGALASVVPAWRAARIDPAGALRRE